VTECANQTVESAGKTSSKDASTDTAVAGIKAIGTHTAADHRSTTADYTTDYDCLTISRNLEILL
jgi:hypothetical protein